MFSLFLENNYSKFRVLHNLTQKISFTEFIKIPSQGSNLWKETLKCFAYARMLRSYEHKISPSEYILKEECFFRIRYNKNIREDMRIIHNSKIFSIKTMSEFGPRKKFIDIWTIKIN